tara:strand:+ start:1099 stop:1434 length:336 start_codon:yes stop_codon:yes gene_type:complete
MDVRKRLAGRLRVLRKRRGLTQDQLSEKIGRSVDAVSNLERGKSLPNFETLERLSQELGVPIRDFFDFNEDDLSPARSAALAELMDIARSLSDEDLGIALAQAKALTRRQA